LSFRNAIDLLVKKFFKGEFLKYMPLLSSERGPILNRHQLDT
jgi:hypothetical protein